MREMEEELKIFIKVWISALISVTYCYYITPKIKVGVFRLLSILPVCALFLVLPLLFSSAHLCFAATIFLTWLANFKLILFAFDQGPLSPLPSNLSHFICFACFPIMPQQNSNSHRREIHTPKFRFAIKLLLFVVALHMHGNRQNLPRILLLGLYPLHLYLAIEIFFGLIIVLVSLTLGCNLEPQFNEPYLATSLQDFWARRWNLMYSRILRSTIYDPVRKVSQRLVNSADTATSIGVFASFLVSGLAHELIFFNLTREMPTWEITLFFVLHGVFTVVEAVVKRAAFVRSRGLDRMVIPVVSQLLTVGFVVLTAGWLFFPQHERSGVFERFADEFRLVVHLFRQVKI